MDNTILFNVGYGLYVLTAKDEKGDAACIINTFMQATSNEPIKAVIIVNKENHTHDVIANTGQFNISLLTEAAPFSIFERFGFKSGYDKFEGLDTVARAKNGINYLTDYANSYISCKVIGTTDLGTNTIFTAEVIDGEKLSTTPSITYAYYHKHTKPQPIPQAKPGYRCTICNYVYEGETLPADFVCPLCKHGAKDFVKA